jgi:hypothetical protein
VLIERLRLRIAPENSPEPPGQGFYQLEEDSLYVQIGEFDNRHRFFSFIDGDTLRMDFDREGRLLFVELAVPRRTWPVDPGLAAPLPYQSRDIRWLDFRGTIAQPAVTASPDRTLIRLRFSDSAPVRTIALASSVFLQVAEDQSAVALWVTRIDDDFAGREIAAFRRHLGE